MSTTATTTTDSEQQISLALTLSGAATSNNDASSEECLNDETTGISLATEFSRRVDNPSWWPTNHRRLPDYRAPRYNPEWRELTGNSTTMDLILVVFFGGCQIMAVSHRVHPNKVKRSIDPVPVFGLVTEKIRI